MVTNSFETGSYPGSFPQTPPAPTPQVALPAGAPGLSLGLRNITIIVAGDITVSSQFANINVIKR